MSSMEENKEVKKAAEKLAGATSTLGDLIPERAELVIKDKVYHLRPVTVEDWAWFENRWGQDQVDVNLQQMKTSELCVVIFRLLEEKNEFLPTEIDDYDDDGNVLKRKITGPERLSREILGISGIRDAVQAFQKSLGVKPVEEGEGKKPNRAQRRAAGL